MAPETPEIVRDLLRREAYGPGVERVTLRTTHASWVFLTERDAFKVKRPVDLGFLDYRTAGDRERACQEEVRLNARLAGDVYLGIVPVRRTRAGHALAGDGPVVDWAVHMRRLPDAASAAAALARGELDPGALAKVAARLARFLAEARLTPSFGTPAALARNVDENFAQMRPLAGNLIAPEAFAEVEAFQRRTLVEHEGRFLERIAEDRIREGHGDVRLEHIYFLGPAEAEPVIIDAIEFNERFRCGDAAAEVAFPAMELEAAGRSDLAAGLVARFAEESDDFGLYGVLDFYVSYRAWVRGKVAAFVAAEAGVTAERRRSKEIEARRCFALARASGAPELDRPYLVAVAGVIGSGKSTLAAALARALAAPVVSSDRTRKALAGLAPSQAGGAEIYTATARDKTYQEILRRAGQVLASGRGVILDATFSSHRWREEAAALASTAGANFAFIETTLPAGLLRRRLSERARGPSVSDATADLLQEFLRSYEPVGAGDPGPRVTVDMSAPVEVGAAAALAELRDRADIAPPAGVRQDLRGL